MRIAISDEDTVAEWLYPGSFPERPTGPELELKTSLSDDELYQLWLLVDPSQDSEAYYSQVYVGDCDIPHDAPSYVPRLPTTLVRGLLAIPHHERWKLAREWGSRGGHPPNEKRLTRLKQALHDLCALFQRAEDEGKFLIILPG